MSRRLRSQSVNRLLIYERRHTNKRHYEVLSTTNASIFIFFFFFCFPFLCWFSTSHTEGKEIKHNCEMNMNIEQYEKWKCGRQHGAATARTHTHTRGYEYHLSHMKWCSRKHSTTVKWIFLLLSVIMRRGHGEREAWDVWRNRRDFIELNLWSAFFWSLTHFFTQVEERIKTASPASYFVIRLEVIVLVEQWIMSPNHKSIKSKRQFGPGPQLMWNE